MSTDQTKPEDEGIVKTVRDSRGESFPFQSAAPSIVLSFRRESCERSQEVAAQTDVQILAVSARSVSRRNGPVMSRAPRS